MTLERLPAIDVSLKKERLYSVFPLGMVYHVGSDASGDPEEAFRQAETEAAACGFLSWRQHSGKERPLEGMNVQPYHHPEIGMFYSPDGGKILVDEEKLTSGGAVTALEEGIDFHPDAAAGYYHMRRARKGLPPAYVVKTHIAAPSCACQAFSQEAEPYQSLVSRALVRGHVEAIRPYGKQVILSVDNPVLTSAAQLRGDLTELLGDVFDGDGVLQGTKTPGIIRAVHSCGDWPVVDCLASGAVDVPHWDATLYGATPVIGNAGVVRAHFERGGMIAPGGVPHNPATLATLAKRLGYEEVPGDTDEATRVHDFLQIKTQAVTEKVAEDYQGWIHQIAGDVSMNPRDVAKRTFVSFPCGMGSSTHDGLRTFAYDLSRRVADALITLYW